MYQELTGDLRGEAGRHERRKKTTMAPRVGAK
jgi:hypothetical protein